MQNQPKKWVVDLLKKITLFSAFPPINRKYQGHLDSGKYAFQIVAIQKLTLKAYKILNIVRNG